MHDLTVEFPEPVSIQEYGYTDEGNHVEAIVVRKGAPKATIVIEAGLRARFEKYFFFLKAFIFLL
jgi:hypothetical protein